MSNFVAEAFHRAMAAWVGWVSRLAALVVVCAIASAAAGSWYVARNFSINTDTDNMLSPDLPFLRRSEEVSQAFRQFSDNLLIVVESEVADLAGDAAQALVERLRERPELFGGVFYPPADPFFRKNGLLYLDRDDLSRLSDRLADAQPFLGSLWRDPTVRGFAEMLGKAVAEALDHPGRLPIELGSVLDAVAGVAEAQAAGRFGVLSWQELMEGETLSAEDRRRLILIQPVLDYGSLEPATTVMGAIRDLARDLALDERRGVRVRLTGSAALSHEELRSVGQNVGVASVASLAMVIALLFWGFRSYRHAIATAITLLVGLIWTAAFAFAAVGRLNLISVAFAVLFIGLSVDFGIHYGLRQKEAEETGESRLESLRSATTGVAGALLLCAVAAAIAFFSFLPTDYRGLAELGLIAGAGMFIAFFANLTVLPALLAVFGSSRHRSPRLVPKTRWQGIVYRRPRLTVVGALVLGVVAAGILPLVRFDFDPLNLRDPNTESMSALFDLMNDSRADPYSITILAPDLGTARTLAARLEQLPEVESASTLADYVPSDQDAKLGLISDMALFLAPAFAAERGASAMAPDARARAFRELRETVSRFAGLTADEDARLSARGLSAALAALAGEGVPEDRALAEFERRLLALFPGRMEALRESLQAERFDLADLPAEIREREVAADGRARIKVNPRDDLTDRDALRRFVRAVRRIAPEATGSPVTILEAGNAVLGAFREAGVIAVGAIVLLLTALLRRLRDVLFVFAPLVLAALLTAAVSIAAELPFNLANIIVLPLLFGLGVANGIHIVLREREAGSVARTLDTTTPRAVVFSALTTMASFGSLALSSHRGMASMGILLTVAITFTLVCTLVVLPAMMTLVAAPPRGAAR